MITFKDIKLAVNELLINQFGIEINSCDLEEGFARPSFTVRFGKLKSFNSLTQNIKSIPIEVYFFPSTIDDNSLEILDKEEELFQLFALKLPVLDRQLNIEDLQMDVSDNVLITSFFIEFEQGLEVEDAPLMEELAFREG